MKAHVSQALEPVAPGGPVAVTSPAASEQVRIVMNANVGDGDGRSDWVWLRLANDDLAIAVFPQGATYEEVEDHAGRWGDGSHLRTFEGGGGIPAGDAVALIHPVRPDLVDRVLAGNLIDRLLADGRGEPGEPQCSWIRLENGDLALGVFQSVLTDPEVASDAAWPGIARDEPTFGM